MKNPVTMSIHISEDLVLNGKDIYAHMRYAMMYREFGLYEKLGKELGDALALVLIGKQEIDVNPALAEIHERTNDEAIPPGLIIAARIFEGMLIGAVRAEGLDNMEACIVGADDIISSVTRAVQDFERKNARSILAGLREMGRVVREIPPTLKGCKNIRADWAKLAKLGVSFRSPWAYFFHLIRDLIVNGVAITREIIDSISQFRNKAWKAFGIDIGMALAKLFIGEEMMFNSGVVRTSSVFLN